jgi:tetratricopeptide (TPR) repeat protein
MSEYACDAEGNYNACTRAYKDNLSIELYLKLHFRLLKQISVAAALGGGLLVAPSPVSLAQQVDEANELNNRVIELYNAGRYSDAIPILRQLLAIREKALGRDHLDVATLLSDLAGLYSLQARYADAEPLYQRSLAIRETGLGRDHPDVAMSLNNLVAALYSAQGHYADALIPAIVGDTGKGAWSRSYR